jgi:hypothetical protein
MQKKQIKNVSDLKFLYFCKTFVTLTYVTKSRERGTQKSSLLCLANGERIRLPSLQTSILRLILRV